ncbi:MAG: helix-turn-helix transcriptional regulator [Oscillospiraceae bacterium]|jgi:transcriptional regulator with XRE-family HTH domain|nr:helix-turn-helix transcriptional regulator [Oscillospiraceae bacterium]
MNHMTFPEHLLKLRLENNLSQQAVADEIGIALRTYQYYERGQREPMLTTLIALADIYDLSLDELVCRSR